MAFSDDETPASATNTGSSKGLVTIKPVKYFKDDAALTADTVTAEVEINATSSTTVREGLDLVAVLDVSGTMDGEKMNSMKKGMLFVIMKLTPVDRLSIVTFSDVATRLSPLRSMTLAAQQDLNALVDGLQANGGTNIQAGLETGLAVIAERVHTKARTANIFLVSGGHQTSGNARQVEHGQVAMYTFGFGRDMDHQLMSDIARKSPGGTFSSVPDGSQVSLPFSQLLSGLLTVVAQDVELTITPNPYTDQADVDTIVVAPGTDYTQDTDTATGVITVKFGTLFAGEGRRVLVTLTLKDVSATVSEEYEVTLAEVQHSFTAQGRPRDPQIPHDILIRRTPSPSQAPDASSRVRQVQAEIARRNHAEVIKQARLLADDGQLDDARGKLVDAHKALDDIVLDRLDDGPKLVNALRAELVQLIKLMETEDLYEAKGRAYALASETYHGRLYAHHPRQRFAARCGDDEDVRLFATPRTPTDGKDLNEAPEGIVKSEDDSKKLVETLRAELLQLIRLMDTQQLYEAKARLYALTSISHGRQRYAARGGDDVDVRLFATPRMDTYREQAKNFKKDPTAPVPTADEDVN
ncbi:hypothetical protein SEVIR_7G289800v4 [Setaria viridis]|uniref:VWFA domain-containing protein n=1 Tax=Setaria viridis TaxID=4556 RepID=A0A4U6U105_SETVI|nr:E3 ubiquitin-protein ligase WAV3-like [Setaria viridis]TKW07163.1 hypothetical protein SEVIR_7G289800v2 [Setaria viridis]